MEKRSGNGKVRLVPKLSSYHSELQKRVAIIGVSLVIILVLVGVGLYVAPGKFVGKAVEISHVGPGDNSEQGALASNSEYAQRVETPLFEENAFSSSTTNGYCQSGTDFCMGKWAPAERSTTDETSRCNLGFCYDYFCWGAGSIKKSILTSTSDGNFKPLTVSLGNNLYCAQSFTDGDQTENYAWVRCDSGLSENQKLTADQKFLCMNLGSSNYEWTLCNADRAGDEDGSFYCDGSHWNECGNDAGFDGAQYICLDDEVIECTADKEDDVEGNYRCDGDSWEQCGDGTPYLCEGRTATQGALECNEDRKYDPEDRMNNDGSIDSADDYYCSYDQSLPQPYAWIQCTRDIGGEGVDNADNHERYGDNYVCADMAGESEYRWLPINNCAACAGDDLEGSCVGSSTVNFRTGDPISRGKYYFSSQIDDRIGCAAENECYYERREYAIDEKVSGTQTICGNDNTFLRCTNGAVAVQSDGGALLCKVDPDEDEAGDGVWDKCTAADRGMQIDNFICSYNDATHTGRWYSEFSCSPNQKYQVRDAAELAGTDRICDGTNWIACTDLAVNNPFTEPGANVTCNGAQFSVKELICNNNIDDDNDGQLDCDDRTQCSNNISYTLNEDNLYEITLKKGDCFTTNIDIDSAAPVNYNQLNVCDLGTEPFGNRVTLCEDRAGTNTPFLTLDSTTLLRNRFGQPYPDTNGLAFIFKEGTPKTVSVMLYRDISTLPEFSLPLATFAPNIAAGQRILLAVDGESYVLWHPRVTANTTFGEQNLKLTHIATGADIPALVYPGTNRYTFDLVGDRLMTFWIDTPLEEPDNQLFKIKALAPGEAPQSFPVPTDLRARFEVPFSKANPVRFINPADTSLGTFSVCRDDNVADPQQVKVCQKDYYNRESFFTLRARTLTERTLGDYNYAFLFEVVNSTKQVSIFTLEPLGRTETPLHYDAFITSLVNGRRIALKFENTLFLLRHPVQPFISLLSITVTRYVGDVTTTFPAIGSQDLIDFLTSEGKINIHRQYGDPPPPFRVSALRIEEIAPVILDRDLSTSMSSLVPVTVNGNIIAAADSVYRLDEQVFNIGIGGIGELLRLRVPAAIGGNALFYYHTVTPSEGALLKQVSIFKLYNLSTVAPTQSRSYNAEFVEQFAGGKQFAILLGGQYYLFSYENNNNEVRSFNINRVRLSTLDRVTAFVAIPDGAGVRFDLPDGKRVRIQVNYDTDTLEMQTGLELLTETSFTGYMTEINPSNEVQINKTANFRMCYLTAYAQLPGARVCDTRGTSDVDALANPLTIVPGSESYVLEVNGRTGNDKRVFVRNLTAIPLSPAQYEIDDWFTFVAELVAHREPYFQVNDHLYVPQATDGRLETFRLKQYPDGMPQAPRNVRAKTPLTANGSIVMNDRVIVIDQQETRDEERPVEASFKMQPYYYLPDNHDVIRFNTTTSNLRGITFVVAVDGTQYTLDTSAPITSLVRLSLAVNQDLSNPLLDRLFASEETKVLTLGGVPVEIKVESIFNGEAQITIKRR